jgi:hypothetical protein
VHQGGLLVFRLAMQKFFNIEQFCEKKFNKIKLNILRNLGQAFSIIGNPLTSGTSWRWLFNF